MTILDRYVLRIYIKVLLVCFGSVAALFVVVETFNNLEEFIELGKQHGGMLSVLQAYFVPRVVSLFDRTSAVLALVAAIFTLTWLHRTSELTAIMAAGVPKSRMVRPLLFATIAVAGIAALNREVIIPHFGEKLVRNAQSWDGSTAILHARYDYRTGIFINGRNLVPKLDRIERPVFRLPPRLTRLGSALTASVAQYERAAEGRPAGYRFLQVAEPEGIQTQPSIYSGDALVVALPHDTPWLEPDEAFVPSEVDVHQLEVGDALKQYASTPQLITELRNPGLDYGASMRRLVHRRIVQPALDLSLFLVGLPLVLARGERRLVVAAGACLGVLVIYFSISIVCDLAADSGWLEAYQTAWAPILLFAPWAALIFPSIDR